MAMLLVPLTMGRRPSPTMSMKAGSKWRHIFGTEPKSDACHAGLREGPTLSCDGPPARRAHRMPSRLAQVFSTARGTAMRSPPAAAGVAIGLAGRVAATGRVSPKLAARLVFGSL